MTHQRRQKVIIDGYYSLWQLVLSSVPQGSVLGPLLFIIYINDKKFADDTKVAYKARSLEDQTIMQDCKDKLVDWSGKWGMEFNID